jgi:alpha-tubulin suppressor-like RCC1 family protein
MKNLTTSWVLALAALSLGTSLTACGGGSSSSGPTSVPNSATVFYAHNLVFRNSTTYATGYNGFGQLGTGNLVNRMTFGAVKGGSSFGGFAIGGDHSVAFYNNSTVRTWGYNGFGQLGNDSTIFSNKPVKPADIAENVQLSGVTAVAAGALHSLALRSDGTVWAWGDNSMGQLGVPITSTADGKWYRKIPVPVSVSGAPLSGIVAIAANGNHALALDSFGTVWAWGMNIAGQVGIDPAITGALAVPTPVAGLPAGGIVAIAAGGATSYAIDTNGKLWAWGNNFNGQLGNGSTSNSYTPVQVPGLPDKVVQVSAGIQHVLVRLADTSVWAWGYDIYDQLGDNDKNKQDKLSPVRVVADEANTPFTNATDIRAFGSSSMARTAAGWFIWGDNTYGQLGTGGKGKVPLPTKLAGF